MSLYANEEGLLKEIPAVDLDSGSIAIQGMDLLKVFNVTNHAISTTVTLPKAISMYKFIIMLYREYITTSDSDFFAVPAILEVSEAFRAGSKSVNLACAITKSSSKQPGWINFYRSDDYTISLKDDGNPANGTYAVYGVF